MTWDVAYYEGQLPLVHFACEYHLWRELPVEGVVWVDLKRNGQTMRLKGFDNYWVHGSRFGLFNDPENYAWYPGAQSVAFDWSGEDPVVLEDTTVPEDAHVLAGVLIPDEDARAIGLLGPNESLPPRPV